MSSSEPKGLEPSLPAVTGRCFNQLSYDSNEGIKKYGFCDTKKRSQDIWLFQGSALK